MSDLENYHKVPKRQWNKWNSGEQCIFNVVYETMSKNQEMFSHPDSTVQKDEHWKTTAWNAAWYAADVHKEIRKYKV